jgi:hypothetical protein
VKMRNRNRVNVSYSHIGQLERWESEDEEQKQC